MKALLITLGLTALLTWFGYAQDYSLSGSTARGVPDNSSQGKPKADQSGRYDSVNERVIELRTQFQLLSQLAQEHKKRAQEISRDQAGRKQWEDELGQELGDRALAILPRLDSLIQERTTLEQAHPNLAASASGGANGRNPDASAFLAKVDERLAAVQGEIADTLEAGKLYTAQVVTNKNSYDISRISYLLQSNGDEVKRLRKEAADLELKKLEFRALRRD